MRLGRRGRQICRASYRTARATLDKYILKKKKEKKKKERTCICSSRDQVRDISTQKPKDQKSYLASFCAIQADSVSLVYSIAVRLKQKMSSEHRNTNVPAKSGKLYCRGRNLSLKQFALH